MNRNKTIRLTESNLHKIIKESVKQILRENNILNEAYGIDIDDTLAWVQKKRPDLSPSAQYKFAQNIIKKRSRDSQLSTSSIKPNGYLIFGDNDTPNIPVMRIPFCYGHGRLEDDWGFDIFSIEKRFEKNMISKYEAKTGTYNCVYNGKPCILEIWLSKDLHKPSGLCYYADDYDAKQYVEDMKKNH
jgi:hypothetical protein